MTNERTSMKRGLEDDNDEGGSGGGSPARMVIAPKKPSSARKYDPSPMTLPTPGVLPPSLAPSVPIQTDLKNITCLLKVTLYSLPRSLFFVIFTTFLFFLFSSFFFSLLDLSRGT